MASTIETIRRELSEDELIKCCKKHPVGPSEGLRRDAWPRHGNNLNASSRRQMMWDCYPSSTTPGAVSVDGTLELHALPLLFSPVPTRPVRSHYPRLRALLRIPLDIDARQAFRLQHSFRRHIELEGLRAHRYYLTACEHFNTHSCPATTALVRSVVFSLRSF
jgi:hypothetical protein